MPKVISQIISMMTDVIARHSFIIIALFLLVMQGCLGDSKALGEWGCTIRDNGYQIDIRDGFGLYVSSSNCSFAVQGKSLFFDKKRLTKTTCPVIAFIDSRGVLNVSRNLSKLEMAKLKNFAEYNAKQRHYTLKEIFILLGDPEGFKKIKKMSEGQTEKEAVNAFENNG